MGSLRVIIGGDLGPTPSNFELFKAADVVELFGEELLAVLKKANFRIFNLEVPLVDEENPIPKWGPNFMAPTDAIKGIKAIKPDMVSLANNHVLDQGPFGLSVTQKTLELNGITYVGAGSNIHEAAQPRKIAMNGLCIGVYGCADREFSIADENSPGANPFDPLESLDHISDLKVGCDYVIVLYHGGKEFYRYPSPDLQRKCRRMVEKGADLVICQHSHCIGSYEKYHAGTIVYGQGNCLLDYRDIELSKTALLVDAEFTSEKVTVDYIPIVKTNRGVALAEALEAKQIMEGFIQRSSQIVEAGFVQSEFDKYAAQMLNKYLSSFCGDKIFSKVIKRLCGNNLISILHSQDTLLRILNYLECEAHRELMVSGLKIKSGLKAE